MLVTLVAILCNGQLCLEKVVTNSEQSGITMTACHVNAQIGIADWLAHGPYQEWKLEGTSVSWVNTLPNRTRDVCVTSYRRGRLSAGDGWHQAPRLPETQLKTAQGIATSC